jgi:hypothetical protein
VTGTTKTQEMAIFFTPFSHTVPGLKFGGVSFLCFSCWMVGCTLLFPDAISEKAEMPALPDADEHLPACNSKASWPLLCTLACIDRCSSESPPHVTYSLKVDEFEMETINIGKPIGSSSTFVSASFLVDYIIRWLSQEGQDSSYRRQ